MSVPSLTRVKSVAMGPSAGASPPLFWAPQPVRASAPNAAVALRNDLRSMVFMIDPLSYRWNVLPR